MIPIRQRIEREEFDYQTLMSALGHLASPRAKVTSLLRQGVIIRVKKGLYVFGDSYRNRPFSRELLANWIYGPSYLSLDYALSFHHLVPERVPVATSVTPKRPKRFSTPLGEFHYRQTRAAGFSIGMDRVESGEVAFLIARPERALADKLRDLRGGACRTQRDVARLLFDDLRIDRSRFRELHLSLLERLGDILGSQRVRLAAAVLKKEKR